MSSDTQILNVSEEDLQLHPGSWLTKAARGLIAGRLSALRGATLVVSDCWGEWTAGSEAKAIRLTVHDPRFYLDVLLGGSLGAGGAYVAGRWSCTQLTELLRLFILNTDLCDGLDTGLATLAGGVNRLRHRFNANSIEGSKRNIEAHYDLGNDFFSLFLDPTMTYSCGIFERPDDTLETASIEKLDRVCRKLGLGPQTHVLEIGTGWGSFALHAAERYGCRVTTTTISTEQREYALERLQRARLSDRVEVLLSDYRELSGRYDALVSIEMVEAVGHAYLPEYFAKCASLLKTDGAMLLQAILMPDSRYEQYLKSSDFIRTYVFPGSCCPSLGAVQGAIGNHTDMKTVHLEEIGPHYATTLNRWRQRLLSNQDAVTGLGYPPRLLRLWDYYLCYCEAGFSERYISTVQMLLHKPGCRMQHAGNSNYRLPV